MKKIILAVLTFVSISTMAQDLLWVKDLAENATDIDGSDPNAFEVVDVEIDNAGFVYVLGNFKGSVDVAPGSPEVNLTSTGKKDIFLVKFNESGSVINVYVSSNKGQLSSMNSDEIAKDMVLSSDGYLYITGSFESDYYFYDYWQDVDVTLTNDCSNSMFVAKIETSGFHVLWAKEPYSCFEDMDSEYIIGEKITIKGTTEIFLTGHYVGIPSLLNGSPLEYSNDAYGDVFYAKISSDGDYQWAKALISTADNKEYVSGIAAGSYLYVTGYFNNSSTFDLNPSTSATDLVTSLGYHDIYLGMYNTSNGTWYSSTYTGSIGTTGDDYSTNIDVDASNNFYLSGYTQYAADLDINSGTQNSTGGFVTKYSSTLVYQWNINLPNSKGIAKIDASGNVVVNGRFTGTQNFNPRGTTLNLSNNSQYSNRYSLYTGKYNSSGIVITMKTLGGDEDMATNGISYNPATFNSLFLLGCSKNTTKYTLYGKYKEIIDFDPGYRVSMLNPVTYQEGRYLAIFDHCAPTTIITQTTGGDIYCEGDDLNMYVNATGNNISYQWQIDGDPISNGSNTFGDISGSSSNIFRIDNITQYAGGMPYDCNVISTCYDVVNSNDIDVEVNRLPQITSNPGNQTSCEGTNISFSVTASNATSYQWLLNNGSGTFAPITDNATYSGSQTATLTINNIQPSQSYFQYKCQVGGTCPPELFSYPATLVVNPNPNIQTQPSNTAICQGTSGSFSISTVGSGLNYQWQMSTDGTNFSNLSNNATYSGVTSSSLNIANAALALNQNQYRCVVSGTCGSNISSNAASLTVNAITTLNSHPTDQTVCENGNVILNVNAQGYNLQYQWQANSGSGWSYLSNGGQYSNVNNSSLNIGSVNTSNSGTQYRCVISSGCSANINSNSAALTVSQTPNVSIVSASGTDACQGQTLLLTLTGTQIGYTYQWTRNFSNLASATQNQLSITQGGAYSVITENSNGCSSESDLIYINYHAVPNVALTTVGYDAFCQGEYAELFVPAGMGNTYQWYQNTSPLLQNSNALIVTESGTYHVVVSNIYGCVSNSVDKTITVHQLPDVSLLPSSDIELCTGSTDTIFAVENPNYFYQWQRNHNDINGANTSQLVVQQSGAFQVDIYDNSTGCMNTSDATFVQMLPLPQPQIQSSNILTFCVNDSSLLNTTVNYNTYQWWNGSTQNQTYVSALGTYALTVSDANGCQNTTQITITEVLVETPPICMVSVDTAYNKNLIVWQNPVGVQGIESYNIYKLVSSSFQLIGNVAYTDTTEFVDFNSEPNIHSDQYAIASVDACGQIGAYSAYHQTMNLSIVDAVGSSLALIWTPYIDEGGLNNPTEYQIYRGIESLSYYASISGGLSDYNYNIPSFEAGERFIIVVQRPEGCSPMYHLSRASGGPYYQSTSNLEDEGIINTGISTVKAGEISVYPNPFNEFVLVKSAQIIETLKLISATGQVIESYEPHSNSYQIETSNLSKGVYVLLINGQQRMNIIKE